MSIFSILFRRKPPIVVPNDESMKRRVKEAKWLNAHAVNNFIVASTKQEHDANLARQVIHDVLMRTEKKAPNHAGNEK